IVCYITTTQPRDNFNTYEREKLAVLRDSILNRFGDFAIDFYDAIVQNPDMIIRPEYSLGDGVHTNPAGQTVLENAVIDKNILFKALPLAFFSVSGHKNENAIEITWSINGGRNTLFSIERSQDGLNFVKIGTVNFLEGKMDYQFVDLNVAHVNNYYRIIGIDQDNKKTYSKIIRVNYNEKTFVNIFYDQTTQDLHLLSVQNNLTNPIILYIFDQSGKTVLKKIFPINNSREYEVNMSDLPKSIYSVLVISCNMKISKNIKN
ncbi:MAG: hypothetical protein ABI168_01380, partial [Ginsengibacter sp.]